MIENESKIVDNYLKYLEVNNIDKSEVVDILDTMCLLDTNFGGKQPLDIDKLHSGLDKEFVRIVEPTNKSRTDLGDVHKVRLLSDSLIIASKKKGLSIPSGVQFSTASCSSLVIGLNAVEDLDIKECLKNLELFFSTLQEETVETDWYANLEDKLKYYADLMKKHDCDVDLIQSISAKLKNSNVKYPFDNIFVEKVDISKINALYRDDIRTYVEETICSAILCAIIGKLKVRLEQNNVYANFCLLKIDRQNYSIGTYSVRNYIPRVDALTGFPSYMVNRIKRIFPADAPYSIDKLETMIKVLIFLSSKHVTDLTYDIEDMTVKA